MQSPTALLLDDIEVQGWGIIPQFIPAQVVQQLKQNLLHRQTNGEFHHAAVGKDKQTQVRADIRGDETLWWQENDLTNNQKTYYQYIDILRNALNSAFFLGLDEFECHYACYPIGAFYQKHLDSFRKNNTRLISCILYLNDDWREAYGGQLRTYNTEGEGFTDTSPIGGTLVCMRSDTVWHEVLPASHARYSITGWLRKEILLQH